MRLLILITLFSMLFACQTMPLKTLDTPYAVGTKTVFIHDPTRPYDSVGGVDVGVRSMLTQIWYPVTPQALRANSYPKATYGDYVFRDKAVHRLMMTQTTFFHLTPETVVAGVEQAQIDAAINELFDRQRASYVDAPLAPSQQGWPIVLMTHGDAGSRYNMETVCEQLAAHGYVVIAPEHTGNSPFSLTGKDPKLDTALSAVKPYLNADGTYGSAARYGQTYTPLVSNPNDPQALVNLDNSLLQRVNDLRAVLGELEQMNQTGEFANQLDLSRIGLMGRSFGGTTTLAALALEDRFSAGVAVVPLLMPDVRQGLADAYLKQGESVLLNAQGATALGQITKPTMLLSAAEDGLIIGAGAGVAESLGGELPTSENPFPPLRASYLNTDQPVVWGLLNNANHGSFGVSGGYWWPELKASTQQRYFQPDETFTLIPVQKAHQIQATKVVQFFDVMLKNQQHRKAALRANEFDDLIYETRNF